MIYFKAVCKKHDWETGLYTSKASAIRSVQAHRRNVPEPHNIKLLQVYIPEDALQIKSTIDL